MDQFAHGLTVQCRVIVALMLREIHTVYGNTKLGYVWVLIQSVFNIAVFWYIRVRFNAQAPHGIAMPMFLAAGFCLFRIFSDSLTKCMTAISGNKNLLMFPQVTPLDVMVARVLVIAATHTLCFIVIVSAAVVFGYGFKPASYGLMCSAFLCMAAMGLGMGIFLTSMACYIPALDKFVPMVRRVLFFISGLFFSVDAFSARVAELLLWNPILHLIEILRSGLQVGYTVQSVSLLYPAMVALTTLAFGCLFERHTRLRRLSA